MMIAVADDLIFCVMYDGGGIVLVISASITIAYSLMTQIPSGIGYLIK